MNVNQKTVKALAALAWGPVTRRGKDLSEKVKSGSIASRLRELQADQSVSAFARKCEIGGSTMQTYLDGAMPGTDKLTQIARKNDVTLDWLATGEGPKQRSALSQIGLARDAAVQFAMRRSSVPEHAYTKLMEEAFREQLDVDGLERRHGDEYPLHRAEEPGATYRTVNLRMLAAATAAVEQRMPTVTANAKAQVVVACYELLAAKGSSDTTALKEFLDAIAGLAVEAGPEHVDQTWQAVERRKLARRKAEK